MNDDMQHGGQDHQDEAPCMQYVPRGAAEEKTGIPRRISAAFISGRENEKVNPGDGRNKEAERNAEIDENVDDRAA